MVGWVPAISSSLPTVARGRGGQHIHRRPTWVGLEARCVPKGGPPARAGAVLRLFSSDSRACMRGRER